MSFGIIILGGATDKVTGNLNVKDKRNKIIMTNMYYSIAILNHHGNKWPLHVGCVYINIYILAFYIDQNTLLFSGSFQQQKNYN